MARRKHFRPIKLRAMKVRLTNEVKSAEAIFEEAVDLANLAQAPLAPEVAALIASVRQGFLNLRTEIQSATTWQEAETIQDRAADLARRRAHVYPLSELPLQARAAYEELSTWKVPPEILTAVSAGVALTASGPASQEADRRGALRLILEAYDYWDWYVAWSASRATVAGVVLGLAVAVSLAVAAKALAAGSLLAGFLTAGAAGACLSVLLRLPPIDVYGAIVVFWVQGFARVVTGIVASAVGLGLLSTGIFSFSIGSGPDAKSLSEVLCLCERHSAGASTAGEDGQAAVPTLVPTAKATRAPIEPTTPAQPPPTDAASTATATPTAAAIGKAGSAGAEQERRPPCRSTSVFFLLALAIVFGFSERMLATFEESILGRMKIAPPQPPGTGTRS